MTKNPSKMLIDEDALKLLLNTCGEVTVKRITSLSANPRKFSPVVMRCVREIEDSFVREYLNQCACPTAAHVDAALAQFKQQVDRVSTVNKCRDKIETNIPKKIMLIILDALEIRTSTKRTRIPTVEYYLPREKTLLEMKQAIFNLSED